MLVDDEGEVVLPRIHYIFRVKIKYTEEKDDKNEHKKGRNGME